MEINGVPLKVKIKELVIKWLSICSKCKFEEFFLNIKSG
jgi:hypothetical protein